LFAADRDKTESNY